MDLFKELEIKNPKNKYIIDVFVKYYDFIYSNQDMLGKTATEIYYKLQNIKKVINILTKYKNTIVEKELENLRKVKYIGEKTIARVSEIINTKTLSEMSDIHKKIETIKELTQIYGIGVKKAIYLYNKKIYTISDLVKSGEPLTTAQEKSLKYYKKVSLEIPKIIILYFEVWLLKKLHEIDPDYVVIVCGSYRREKDFSSDIDCVLTHKSIKNMKQTEKYLLDVVECLYKEKFLLDVLNMGKTQMQGYANFKLFKDLPEKFENVVRIDIKCVPIQSLWCCVMHSTGSYVFTEIRIDKII
jgi:DNA polymerase/3'-5' exonuclease PolX